MKLARGLALLVTVALIGTFGTACGKKAETSTASDAHLDTNGPAAAPSTPSTSGQQTGSTQTAAATAGKSASKSPSSQTATVAKNGSGATAANAGSTSGTTGGSTAGGNSSPAPAAQAGQFALAVTQNFGSTGLFDQAVGSDSGENLLDVMRDHLTVETAYGGGFVNSINGIKSGYTDKSFFTRKKRDWFYYVNGSVAAVGADAIAPHAGDAVWWDYHDWTGNGSNTPCVVGEYPHPFTGGYNEAQAGTLIYYSGSHASAAQRLAAGLTAQGAGNVATAAYQDSGVASPAANTIVVGTWSELSSQSALAGRFGNPAASGLYAKFADGAVAMLDYKGNATGRTGQALILATGAGSGSTTPLWLVIGANDAALDQAIGVLVNSPGKLHNKIGAVISGGDAYEVPVAP